MGSADSGDAGWMALRGVSLVFGHIRALNGVDFDIRPGEIHVLVGNHNDGKSTLCRILAGIAAPDSGDILVDGGVRARHGIREAADLGVEYLGEAAEVFPHLSILENMTIGTYAAPRRFFAPAAERERLAGWLDGFGLEYGIGKPAANLSSEDRLLVKILGSLYKNPRLLILDETLEQFTHDRRLLLMDDLRSRAKAGMSVLWATHKLDEALEWADRVTVLRNGRRYLAAPADRLDRRSLIRMTYSSTRDYSGDSSGDFENYYNLVRYSEVLLGHLPSAVLVMDEAEKVQFANASGLALLSLEGTFRQGMPAAEALGDGNGRIADMVREALRKRSGAGAGSVPFVASGREILVDVRVLAVPDAARRLSVMLILDDVSEREAMRGQLAVAHNLSSIGMLAAGVAHEVNNPLESIGNYISYLLRRVEEDETRDILAKVRREAGGIRDIVTNLVMFSGKGERKGADLDVVQAIGDIVDMLGYNAHYDEIEIEFRRPERPLAVKIDPNEFRQILLNLLRNSMEAMPGGGAIRVEAAEEGGRARVAVRDYGDGIAPELLSENEIFLPFVSGKAGGDANQGLGLSIVYGLVKKWGGEIAVEAAKPGTRFLIDFPLRNNEL